MFNIKYNFQEILIDSNYDEIYYYVTKDNYLWVYNSFVYFISGK